MSGKNKINISPNLAIGSITQLLFVFGYDYLPDQKVWVDAFKTKAKIFNRLTLEEVYNIEKSMIHKQIRFMKVVKSMVNNGWEIECENPELTLLFYYDPVIAVKGDTKVDLKVFV